MLPPIRWPCAVCILSTWLGLMACGFTTLLETPGGPTPTGVGQTATPPGQSLSVTQLKYALLEAFGPPFFCDPDYYPVSRGDEQQKAKEWFAQVEPGSEEIQAILGRLALEPPLSEEETLLVYREHKLLGSILLEPSGTEYRFEIRTGGEPEGEAVRGSIDDRGRIDGEQRERSFNTCPICLAAGTLIDTPEGQVAVQDLRPGMPIWTVDAWGARTEAFVLRTGSVPVPAGFDLVRLRLEDGRQILASAGHPLADGRSLGDLLAGDTVDEVRVASVEQVRATGPATYDVLPDGRTALYWANGILLQSTLASLTP